MGEDLTRGSEANTNRDVAAPSGWVTTQQAARALGISPRTVRWHIEQGNLEAQPQGEAVRRTWYVSIDSLQAFRDKRQLTANSPGTHRTTGEDAEIAAESIGNPIRELADRLAEEAARAAEYRVRLELTEQAQTTLESELADERARREQAERRVAELEEQLQELPELPESPHKPQPEPERGGTTPEEASGPMSRPWYKRWFGV